MKKFDKSFNGYNVNQVNAFVDDVVDKVDDMITKMKEKDLIIDRLTKELEHYKSMDATLNRAVVMAEEASNKYKENSLNESDLIITEAKKNANRIINDALMKAEHIEEVVIFLGHLIKICGPRRIAAAIAFRITIGVLLDIIFAHNFKSKAAVLCAEHGIVANYIATTAASRNMTQRRFKAKGILKLIVLANLVRLDNRHLTTAVR